MEKTGKMTRITAVLMVALLVVALAFMALFALSPAITAKATPAVYEGGATLDLDALQVGDVIAGAYSVVTGNTITVINLVPNRYAAMDPNNVANGTMKMYIEAYPSSFINKDGTICFHISDMGVDFYPIAENGEQGTGWVVVAIENGEVCFGGYQVGQSSEQSSVVFSRVTDESQITAENIGTCTAEDAKAWILANWDDLLGDSSFAEIAFYSNPGELKVVEVEASVSKEDFSDDYDMYLHPGLTISDLQAWFITGDPVFICTAAPTYAQYKNTTTVIKFDDKDWYLIDYDDSTVTLLSKECVGASRFGSENTYAGSTVETAVNNYYAESISTGAKTAVSNNNMFLLSTDEAKIIYNANPDVLKCSMASGAEDNVWWLCSQGYDYYYAAGVYGEDGEVDEDGYNLSYEYGVRPALKLDLSKVEFDSETKTFAVPTPTHTHDYSTDWSSDASTHWHACTAEEGECDAPKADEAAHTYAETMTDATYYTCSFCSYVDNDRKAAYDSATAVAAVKAKIAAIGTVEYTTESKGKIDEAREAYDALTEDQQALVDNVNTLTAAETEYAALKADNDAADAVDALIAAIGTVTYSQDSKDKIDAARDAYDALTEDQQALVDTLDTLTAAESAYATLKADSEAHVHDDITFTEWTSTTSLPGSAGNYYLTADVTLGGAWTVPSGTTNLCLNGHGIKTTSGRVININGGTLNLYDCGTIEHYFDVNDGGKAVNVNDTSGEKSFTGGYITGGNGGSGYAQTGLYWGEAGGILVWSGAFNMYGGTILGNAASSGGGVEVVNATMNFYDGSIIYNGGAGINLRSQGYNTAVRDANLNMYGGNICYNTGTGIDQSYCYGNRSLKLYGGSVSHNKGNGIWCSNVVIDGAPVIEENSGVGVTIVTSTIKGGPIVRNNNGGDVWIGSGYKLDILEAWDCDPMSVVMQNNVTGIFTSGWSTYMGDKNIEDVFTPHNDEYVIVLDDASGELLIYKDHVHNYSENWSSDADRHWHACAGDTACPSRSEGAEHSYGESADTTDYYTCSVCGYENGERKSYYVEQNACASVTNGDVITKYATFGEALAAWANGTTLTLLKDVTVTAKIQVNGGATKTLDLNGYTLTLSTDVNEQRVIELSGSNTTLNLKDSSGTNAGKLTGVDPEVDDGWSGAVYINSGATFNMYGGTITGNRTIRGAGVWIDGRGHAGSATFNMYGGVITGNESAKSAGDLTEGYSLGGGGGVFVGAFLGTVPTPGEGHFNMYGGTITGNTASNGDNVYVGYGVMTMTGGTIDGGFSHSDYVTVTFDANGGTGTMSVQYVKMDTDTTVKANEYFDLEGVKGVGFTRTHHLLIGWNTQADGMGTTYLVGESDINVSEDTVLYAMWQMHDYSTEWSHDNATHWHACVADGDCDAPKKDEAAHAFGGSVSYHSYYICSVCGYEDPTRKAAFEDGRIRLDVTKMTEQEVNDYDSIADFFADHKALKFDLAEVENWVGIPGQRAILIYAFNENSALYVGIDNGFCSGSGSFPWGSSRQSTYEFYNGNVYYVGYVSLDTDVNPDVNLPEDKEEVQSGDEISVDPQGTDTTTRWYYDDDGDGLPDDPDHPIGEGDSYTIKCPDEDDPTHDDTGHTIIGVITQNTDENGDPYPEDQKPTTTTKPVKVKDELNQGGNGQGGQGGSEPPADTWELNDPEEPSVKVEIIGADDVKSEQIANVKVEIKVKAEVETKAFKSDYKEIRKAHVAKDEQITFVYEVKLIRKVIDPNTGEETLEEIQPSDIKEGATIKVTMEIPKALRGKDFKLLHIHSADDIEYITDYVVSEDGTMVEVEINRLSEFAFISEKGAHGFCVGWVVFILVMLELLFLALYFILWLPKAAFIVEKCRLTELTPKRCLLGKIGSAVACAIFIFALVAICIHQCAITIVSFVLALLILAAFIALFVLSHKDLVKGWIKAAGEFCRKCGKKVSEFCRKCGKKVSEFFAARIAKVRSSFEEEEAPAPKKERKGRKVVDAVPAAEEQPFGYYRITKDAEGRCTFALLDDGDDALSCEMGVFPSEKDAKKAIKTLSRKAKSVEAENRVSGEGEGLLPPKFMLDVDNKGVYRYFFIDEDGCVLLQSVQYLNECRCLEDLLKTQVAVATEKIVNVDGTLKETPIEEIPLDEEEFIDEEELIDEDALIEEETSVAPVPAPEKKEEVTLKQNFAVAKATVSHSKVNKDYVADYLRIKYGDKVACNKRANETSTGLPLADTHYVAGDEGKCFVYVYEVENTTMLLVKVNEEYGQALKQQHPIVKRSAFPKAPNAWYSVIVDDSFAPEEVEAVLDEAYAQNGGDGGEEGVSLKETLAEAKATSVRVERHKAGIVAHLTSAFGDKVEINTRGNMTRTGLPLADTHYAVQGDKKACFVYVYEVGAVVLLVRLPEDYAEELIKKHPAVKRSAFPKAPYAWYSVILDDSYADEEVDEVLNVAYKTVL